MSPDRQSEEEDRGPGQAAPVLNQETQALFGLESPFGASDSSTPYPDTETLSPGDMLGSFRILQHIGSGGMGQVYRARDKRLNRDVAIKILPRVFGRNPDLVSRFQSEARAASALNHPNVVAIHDIGNENDLCWFVSELVDGHSLRSVLEAGPLKVREIVEIGSQVAEGLGAAHAAGLIHRDLKPENIMITREDRVKILDFGLAKSAIRPASGSASMTVTQSGVVLGTPGYMSPEQIVGGQVDERSDIFSLGVILYEMLTRRRPFTGENRVAIMKATLTEDPPLMPLTLPLELSRIALRCLEKEPRRRLQSAADAAFALQMALGSSSQNLVPLLWQRNRWLRGVVIAGACVLVSAGLFWAGFEMHPSNASAEGVMRRLTWDYGLTTDGAISPDGRFVAYASDRGNERDLNIYVQQVDGGGILQLTNDSQANDEPTFNPDGSRIAFESRSGYGGIYEMPALGGERRLIAAGGRHPRFSPDGQFILYARVGSEANRVGGAGAGLFVQPISGGAPIPLTRGCSDVMAEAVWSPDSQNILATATCGGKLGIWRIRRDGASIRETNGSELWDEHQWSAPRGLTYQGLDQWLTNPARILLPLAQGDAVYAATIPISNDGLKFVDSVNRLNFGPGRTEHASMSADGRTALTSVERLANLWELPIDATGHPTGKPVQITRSQAFVIQPAVSRDGRMVAFVLSQTGRNELGVLNFRNENPVPMTIQTGWIRHPVFSPDGSKISYENDNTAFEIDAHGGVAAKVFKDEDGYVSDWSADGRSFLWISRAPGQTGITVVDRATLRRTLIVSAPGCNLYQAHFSPNQKYVTFNAFENQRSRIYAALLRPDTVSKSAWISLTDGTAWDDKPRLSADGKLLFFISESDGFPCIWLQRLTAGMHPDGRPEAIFHSHSFRRSLLAAGLGDLELNVSRDMLIFTQGDTLGNIWVLDPPAKGKR